VSEIRLGQLSYINSLPIYHPLEDGLLAVKAQLVKQPPTTLNNLLYNDELDASPVSSIEYAVHREKYYILPDLSISADGRVMSVMLFSKVPMDRLGGKRICLTNASATGVALTRILFDHYYRLKVDYQTCPPDLEKMLQQGDGAFLIGDNAMEACRYVTEKGLPYQVTDLGEVWKQFTGLKMVYALWVARRDFARENPAAVEYVSKTLLQAKEMGLARLSAVREEAHRRSGLPMDTLEEYYRILEYHLDQEAKKALLTFYDYAYQSGIIDQRVQLEIWGE